MASSEYSFPVPDETYDVVLSGQVIEHVRKIWVWMREVARVCKAGGIVITINPVSWPYHEAPIDCWRAYPEGMKALYEDSKLEVIFSGWESLEEPQFRNYMPGASREARIRRSWDWLTDCSADSGIRSNVPMTRLQSVGRRPGLRSFGSPQQSAVSLACS